MDWIESIKEIKTAKDNNRLVVFVGAGISKNSNLPSWWELIKKISLEIGYSHDSKCNSCLKQSTDCPKGECKDLYNFTQDEYLRIPEYFYQLDKSKDHDDYYRFIEKLLESKAKSNPIDDKIIELLPNHIITTNYDYLLENSEEANTKLFTVISKDEELLSKQNNRYLIKMHGSLSEPRTMILKESDYIEYEQKHPLICTFIKSLLINHTFLFLGYSLNDYNLNLIIGWINYFQKEYGVSTRQKSFLITNKRPEDYEQLRQNKKDIYVIDISKLPIDIINKVSIPKELTSSIGRNIYVYLQTLIDQKLLEGIIPLEKILIEKYEPLKSFEYISHDDFRNTFFPEIASFTSTSLILHEDEWFHKISEMIQNRNQEIISIFQKAGISVIENRNGRSTCEVQTCDQRCSPCYINYIDNDYIKLKECAYKSEYPEEKVYYFKLLGASQEYIDELIRETYQREELDYIGILICKMRERLSKIGPGNRQEALTCEINQLFITAPEKYRNAIEYLRMLFESQAKHYIKMQKLLQKQEERNKYGHTGFQSGHAFSVIWELQAYAYDFYTFFKSNCLPLDYFMETKEYFSYYIKAILCSYIPVAQVDTTLNLGLVTDQRPYPINDYDIDIIVKYCDYKSFSSWIEEYHIQKFYIRDNVDINKKFKNLCNSYLEIGNDKWIEQIKVFAKVICLIESEKLNTQEAFLDIVRLFINTAKKSIRAEELIDIVYLYLKKDTVEYSGEWIDPLLGMFFQNDLSKSLYGRYRTRISFVIQKCGPYVSNNFQQQQIKYIDSIVSPEKRAKQVYQRRIILPKNRYRKLLYSEIDRLSTEELFDLLTEKYLILSSRVKKRFLNTIEELYLKRKNSKIQEYPDWLQIVLEEYLLLYLLGFKVDLKQLSEYKDYSVHLQFMLNPEGFDYAKVNLDNYMWQNLIYTRKYRKYFITNKDQILTSQLREVFSMNLATKEQQKIVYRFLSDEGELRKL